MPYIKDTDNLRHNLHVGNVAPSNAGELNFTITMLVRDYLRDNGMNYQKINDVLGALEGAKLEFYRKTVVPYENQKINENGDL